MRKYLIEIETTLNSYPKISSSQNPETYIGGGQSKLKYIGLRVPQLQHALKTGFSFSSKEKEEIAKIWNYVWMTSNCYEVMSLALAWFYDPKQKHILKEHWPMLEPWSLRIDNWAHSDTLSGIYARIHEESPQRIYEVFKEWSLSKNSWLRRLSLVSLIYQSAHRTKFPTVSKIKTILKPQLEFDDHYVQKGVGWLLRESGNVYPKEISEFINKNISRISATAFHAATEKMTIDQRNKLKLSRKEIRKKPRLL